MKLLITIFTSNDDTPKKTKQSELNVQTRMLVKMRKKINKYKQVCSYQGKTLNVPTAF